MLQKKRKRYWFYKILSVLVSCAFPIWAIYEKFPVWTMTHGATRSVGAGGILCMIVILIVFRKSVFKFLADRLKLRHAPPYGCVACVVDSFLHFNLYQQFSSGSQHSILDGSYRLLHRNCPHIYSGESLWKQGGEEG